MSATTARQLRCDSRTQWRGVDGLCSGQEEQVDRVLDPTAALWVPGGRGALVKGGGEFVGDVINDRVGAVRRPEEAGNIDSRQRRDSAA